MGGFGAQQSAAAGALVKELAGIGRHRLGFRYTAIWTSDDGLCDHGNSFAKLKHIVDIGGADG